MKCYPPELGVVCIPGQEVSDVSKRGVCHFEGVV